ncbi:MAG: hypothetical protein KUG59_03065 [Parvibaculaceae bacterium]|nr:hypothetical protein [Parvibaculaceae bacterium]
MVVMKTPDGSVMPMMDHERLLQTLSPALSDTCRFGLPVDAPHAQWVAHIIQIGTCRNELNAARYIDLFLEHSECGAVWLPAPEGKGRSANSVHFARINDHVLDSKAYGIVYAQHARFSRVHIGFVGEHEKSVPISALALIGPTTA